MIFIDGCFWHGCPQHYTRPRTRVDFWAAKLAANFERDARHTRILAEAGWRVLRFWEHEVEQDVEAVCDLIAVFTGQDHPAGVYGARSRLVSVSPADSGLERHEIRDLIDPGFQVELRARNRRSGVERR